MSTVGVFLGSVAELNLCNSRKGFMLHLDVKDLEKSGVFIDFPMMTSEEGSYFWSLLGGLLVELLLIVRHINIPPERAFPSIFPHHVLSDSIRRYHWS